MNDTSDSAPLPTDLDTIKQQLAETNATFPDQLVEIEEAAWPEQKIGTLMKVWRSKKFIARLTRVGANMFLSVQKAELLDSLEFVHNEITWTELMQVLAQAGFSEQWAVEVYPPHEHVWHELNSRDLWLLPCAPEYGWRLQKAQQPTSEMNGSNGSRVEFVSEKCEEAPAGVLDALIGRANLLG